MKIKRILIVGGGSAGWMAAAYLNAALNRGEYCHHPFSRYRVLNDLHVAPRVLPRHEIFLQQALGMPAYPVNTG